MPNRRFHTETFLGIAAACLVISANVQGGEDLGRLERKKADIVDRLYEATYGMQEKCTRLSPTDSVDLKAAIAGLRQARPELFALLESSPYFSNAREQYQAKMMNSLKSSTAKVLAYECKWQETTLRYLYEDSNGQQLVKEIIQVLKS